MLQIDVGSNLVSISATSTQGGRRARGKISGGVGFFGRVDTSDEDLADDLRDLPLLSMLDSALGSGLLPSGFFRLRVDRPRQHPIIR